MSLQESGPWISVVVAVFNGEETLQQCLNSIVSQTYKKVELIVIDGGSTDGTVELLKNNDNNITHWISEPDKGIYNAWNKALKIVAGDWICFIGSDDFLWKSDVLDRIALSLQKISLDKQVAYSQIMLLNRDGVSLNPIGKPWLEVKSRFKQSMCIPHQGIMHRRSLFEKHGLFDEQFKICGDYELLLRELQHSDAVFISDVILTGMRVGGVSSNPAWSMTLLKEMRLAHRKHGQRFPGFIWLLAVARTSIRLVLFRFLGEHTARKLLDFGRKIMGLPAFWTKT